MGLNRDNGKENGNCYNGYIDGWLSKLWSLLDPYDNTAPNI